MADIPGLVEGAAEGRASGTGSSATSNAPGCSSSCSTWPRVDGAPPADQLGVLLDELGRYRPDLLERPRLVVGSKADLPVGERRGRIPACDLAISAVTGRGHARRCSAGWPTLVDRGPRRGRRRAGRPSVVIHRPLPEGIGVERLGPGRFEVTGRAAERAVALSDLTDHGALDEALGRLRRLGVDRALARAGARDGDEVEVGELSFTWYRDEQAAPAAALPGTPRRRRSGSGRRGAP